MFPVIISFKSYNTKSMASIKSYILLIFQCPEYHDILTILWNPLYILYSRLTGVSIVGAATSNSGPTINHLKSTSSVTILANNEPYGVVGWKNRLEITTEDKEVNSSALLIIRREHGALADIRVDYQTKQAVSVSQNERVAIPGVDYFTKRSFVVMKKDAREAIVYIKVRHVSNAVYMLLNE